jgi:uncharacterized RDD family membrane protein YckC
VDDLVNGTYPADQRAASFPVAGLDRRFYAFAVDRALAWGLYAATAVAAWVLLDREPWPVVGTVAGVAVLTWLGLAVLLGIAGTSPGKAMAGLRVVHHGSGTPVGAGRALLRSLVLAIASLPTFGLGLASLAWTAVADAGRQRRGWHDHVAHSVVVDVRPVAEEVQVVEEVPRHVVNLTAMRLVPAPAVMPEQALPPQHPARPASQPPAFHPPPASERTVVRGSTPPVPAPAGPVTPAGPPRWRATFDTGESFVVEGLVLVGRRPEPRAGEAVRHLVPLSSADMSVSKTHAQLGPGADGVIAVMDRGSTNGSVLLRQGVSRQLTAGRPATLLDGDQVLFGDRAMTISRES